MKDKVLAAIKANDMLKQGDRVVVGLSGGADSVALLCVLNELKSELGITLAALHVNHCLRGEESDSDQRFCEKLCAEKGIDFTTVRIDVLSYCREHKVSTEEGARELRYRALLGFDENAKVATAHTLSDNAETVIMNLARGSALDGLCGIPPVRGRIIRPIIGCSRADVEAFLASLGQGFVTDSTNLTDDYSRNRVRHNIIPLLKEMNPAFEQSVKRASDALREDKALLEEMAQSALKEAREPLKKDFSRQFPRLKSIFPEQRIFAADILAAQPQPVRMRAYKSLLNDFSLRYDAARLANIDALLLVGSGAVPLENGVDISCKSNKLYICRSAEANPPKTVSVSFDDSSLPKNIKIYGGRLQIRRLKQTEIKFFVNNRSFQFKNAIDCDRINDIVLRPRKPGDKAALFGRGCTQTFKNLFNSAGLPAAVRDSLIVAESNGAVVWLEGFGVCESAALTGQTKRAVLLDIAED